MKRTSTIFIYLCILFFISCNNRESGYIPELSKAESLLDSHPDSAMHILHALNKNKVNKNEAVRMNYYLLLYQAEDRCYIDHTSDSIMLKVVHYYEKNQYGDQPMRAYYQLGRVYDDMGDSPEALKYYHKALDLSSTSKSHSTIGRIYSQIGNICYSQGIYNEAISAYQFAYKNYILAKDSLIIPYALRDIGSTYVVQNNADKGFFYYRKAYFMALKIRNQIKVDNILSDYADMLMEQNRYNEAYRLLSLLKIVNDSVTLGFIYSTYATYYQRAGKSDSAIYYGKKALSVGNVYVKYEATYRLFQALSKQGNYKEAVYFVNQNLNYGDSIRDLKSTAEIKKMQSLYNYNHFMRGKNELILKNKMKQQIIYLIVIGGLLIIFCGGGFVYRQKKKKDEELNQERNLLDIERMENKNDKDLLDKNEKIIADLHKQLNNALFDADKTRIEEQKSRLVNENRHLEQRQKAEKEFKVS